ncbi:MAG: hypothetical protein QQN63_00200 [Nitrosopumilus sp.]
MKIKLQDKNKAYRDTVNARRASGDTTKPYGGRLENWVRHTGSTIEGRADYVFFSGDIYDDPNLRWSEGQLISTSIVTTDYRDGDSSIETMNTLYTLGEPA